MLKILVGANVPPDPNSGAAGTVYQMNAALRSLGHGVDEIWQADLGRKIQHGNLHYLLELPYTYQREVRKRCASKNYDVIELNQPHAYKAAIDHRRSGRPGVFVNRSHGHEVRSEESLQPWKEQFQPDTKRGVKKYLSNIIRYFLDRQWELICKATDGFIVSCRDDAEFLKDRFQVPAERVGIITQGVSPAFHKPVQPYTTERQTKLLYVGQFAFFKAPHMLAKAVSLILSQHMNATFTWVCSPSHHLQVKELFDPSILSRVKLIDWMPQEQLISFIDQHGIFLFPSYFEGFGKAPLEAMARGLCVVASETGGMRDYILSEQNGVLVPIGKPEMMADRVLQLMQNINQCRTISQAAIQTAAKHTWQRCAADAVEFYQQLISLKMK